MFEVQFDSTHSTGGRRLETLSLSLTTFLKITARTTRGKISELKTFTKPGGYDFYKVMKRLAHDLASGTIDFESALQKISAIKQAVERAHTKEAITRFYAWLLTQAEFKWVEPPKGLFKSPSGLLKVNITPEIAFANGKAKPSALQLWNLKSPEMKAHLAAKGIRLLVDNLPHTFASGIFDLRSQKIHTVEVITGTTDVQLQKDIDIIEVIWGDLHDASMSTEDMVEHVRSLSAS